jgi:hypothetical protein
MSYKKLFNLYFTFEYLGTKVYFAKSKFFGDSPQIALRLRL